jgi:undecaprenyl phosphate-alpha-L-ara4FN deformylase
VVYQSIEAVMTRTPSRVALKIDVDTYRGTREGVPAILDELAAAGVRASFFFTLGPDNSGRAIFRVLTHPGFAEKMLRTNAIRMYGWKTALYGTLLPAPVIGRHCANVLRRCQAAGHEVALHGWDHVRWQDALPRLTRPAIAAALAQGVAAFEEVFGAPARAFAAPAWLCTEEAFEAIEARGFAYISVSRGQVPPYRPRLSTRTLSTLEIPTTLPTLDEDLGRDGITAANYVERLTARYRPGSTEVLTVHAETEGIAHRRLFRDLLARHRHLGLSTVTLGALAEQSRADALARDVSLGPIPGRAGVVTRAGRRAYPT